MSFLIVKKTPLKHGTQEYIYVQARHHTVLIDDMTSTGDTIIDAAQKIRANAGNVNYAIISAYRDKTAVQNVEEHGIKLLAIASFDEIINYLKPLLTTTENHIIQTNPLIFG